MKEVVRYEFGPLVMEADLYHMTFSLITTKDNVGEFVYVFHSSLVPELAKIQGTKLGYATIQANADGKKLVYIFAQTELDGKMETFVGLPCGTILVEEEVNVLLKTMGDCCRMLAMDFSQV